MTKKTLHHISLPLIILAMLYPNSISAQTLNKQLGIFEGHSDVGNVQLPGSATYDAEKQEYTIQGSGTNIWFGSDEFHYLWKKIKGDFILTAQVEFVGKGVEAHRKIGWMVRQSLEPNAPQISAMIHGDELTSLQYRHKTGADMEEKRMNIQGPDVVQLVRKGNTYIMSVTHWGETFVSEQVTDSTIADEAYIGLFICAHNPKVSEKAVFKNVRIEIPASASLVPYTDYIGSNLETMDVATGARKILYQVPYSIQAPNWTPDGKTLIFNSKGLLYNFDLATGKPSLLNTGFANNNNNDHVLSFDGKLIGISHHSADDKGQSVVYYLPATGGKPTRVTSLSPSYFHGWSPDKEFLIYTGGRNNQFDIYKISVEGGKEVQLTNTKGLDDGSEFTPDGKYIYFNSTRAGNMQIWRMKPDGSEQEQVTFDTLNNWFPHVSPDGKSIVFITFLNDVKPDDHPFYKHVYLRMMPISGGEPKVIAYLYGGQGTINVPSWSPDSKSIAFVSNTDLK
ncbi:MAG: SMP-30/gluconolactonase/LRE family protein [Bacteroidales bacterium]|nr:SMP-30/gluconolactonase/LRE family protein [Bacteroidales bacterium]